MEVKEMTFYDYDKYLIAKLTGNQEKVYRCLMSHKNRKEAYSYPKQELIAKETGLGISTIKRAIKVLVEKGFIIVEKMKALLGHFNKYKMLIIPVSVPKKQNGNNDIDLDNSDIEAPESTNVELVASKLDIDITSKQAFGINKFFTDKTILETITLFKRKKGRNATFFIQLCIDRAFANGTATEDMANFYKVPFVQNQISMTECINEFSKTKPTKALKFANYDQRDVDYDSFEDELLNSDWEVY